MADLSGHYPMDGTGCTGLGQWWLQYSVPGGIGIVNDSLGLLRTFSLSRSEPSSYEMFVDVRV